MRTLWEEIEQQNGDADAVPERRAVDPALQWDLEALYADEAAWEEDFKKIDSLVEPLVAMRGTLDSPEQIRVLFETETTLDRLVDKLHAYAHLRADENTADDKAQARQARIRAKTTEVAGRLAWILPEMLSQDEETLRAWTESETLAEYRHNMIAVARRKPHTLSDAEETLLSRASEILSASAQTYSLLTNADMRFPNVKDAGGRERELSQGRYVSFLLNRDRDVRRAAFNAMYDTYGSYRNTLASTLSAAVKRHNFSASIRNFGSALEASLFPDQIPTEIYENMLGSTHEALPHYHAYVALRKKRLGLEDLGMHDLYVPIVPKFDLKVSYEQAQEWILEACRPLGEEYAGALREAFAKRWIDVMENRGKRSGAYSGGCYDSMPYILTNFQGTLNCVFTLAHELGHSVHSWFANRTQPAHYAHYPIFIAEIPSTLNEALLLRHLLETTDDPHFRAFLLNHLCDSFKGTVYRQTMFAEFEKTIHEMDAAGEPLTPDPLSSRYFALNESYQGPEVVYDERIGLEWSRIPHFYYNFYVYKYATSFCASRIFFRRVLEGGEGLEKYLDLLKAGGSGDPLDLIGAAGVDLASRETLSKAFEEFGKAVAQLETTLGELGGA